MFGNTLSISTPLTQAKEHVNTNDPGLENLRGLSLEVGV